jgi:2Fe-2S ferredoxin
VRAARSLDDAAQIEAATQALAKGTEAFAALRMNRGIQKALAGKNIETSLNQTRRNLHAHHQNTATPRILSAGCRNHGPRRHLDLRSLLDHHINIEHACDMSCACTTCHVIVREGFASLNELDENEEDLLDRAWGLEPNSRLSCQAFLAQKDLVVEIPKYSINHAKENPLSPTGQASLCVKSFWTPKPPVLTPITATA